MRTTSHPAPGKSAGEPGRPQNDREPHTGGLERSASSRADGYDIIGDLHGQAGPLRRLLATLGYRERLGGYRYPGGHHQAIFVGDCVDHNPNAREVLGIVERMCEESEALAVMGNHEFNAVAYHTWDDDEQRHLRPHSAKNRRQHEAFLAEVQGDEAAHDAAIAWFRSLPMWLDLGALRIVHATWAPRHQAVVERLAEAGAHLSEPLLKRASRTGTPEHAAVECLLKGLEVALPDGVSYADKDGTVRREGRLRWWLNAPPRRLREALIASPEMLAQLGDTPWSGPWPEGAGYARDAPPVFIGHYWLSGVPQPLASNVACVDYSAARSGEKLVAYRWDGETRLSASRFVAVPT